MIIKVLGSGCANCQKLEQVAKQVVADLVLDAQVVKVTDMGEIMGYGVMSTPALVVDEQLRLAGRVPTYGEVVTILTRDQ
ncbi:MAG: redox-active disulfide protein 2 [Actinobacteria bacterium HGW-Actinobacteria-7]|nr:MAG: redox-active disulfide protein 2 [Actinobacteria bacterium HGW-Actinobacteria-7]